MAFLQGLITSISVSVLNWLYGKISSALAYALRAKAENDAIKAKNEAITKQTEAAETREDREKAARDMFNNL